MKISFTYGRTVFDVQVHEHEYNNLKIDVHPDLRITAFVPVGKPQDEIKHRISQKAQWIVKQLHYFDRFHPLQPPREYINGETHYYLGRQYRLRISTAERSRIKLKGMFFEVDTATPKDIVKVRNLMRSWYTSHAREMFERKINEHYPFFQRRGAEYPKLLIRTMQKRWGSCTGQGTITLNTELVKAPLVCIDYVIIHELCHLIHPNHDKKFYRLMSAAMPDWEKWKDRLEMTVVG